MSFEMAYKLQNLYESLDIALECPVCWTLPNSNIFQCVTGHAICSGCKARVTQCPTCKADFMETRNYVAENLVTLVNDMKISVQCELNSQREQYLEELMEYKKELFGKELKSQWTQTKYSTIQKLVSSSTQTDKRAQENSKVAIRSKPKGFTVYHACLIGVCPRKLPYGSLIGHLTQSHQDYFKEVHGCSNLYREKFTIICNVLPKYHDFAFLVHGMGLFFFKTVVDYTGGLCVCVKIAKDTDSNEMFEYAVSFGNEHAMIQRSGLVESCQSRAAFDVYVKADRKLPWTGKNFIECILSIRRCR